MQNKRAEVAFVRLLFAAQNLVSGLRHCWAGERRLYCSVCQAVTWPTGPHAAGCPLARVAAIVSEILATTTVEDLGRGLEGELEAAPGDAVYYEAPTIRLDSGYVAPTELGGSGGPGGRAPGARGEPGASSGGLPGRKPPARVDETGAEAVAVGPGETIEDWGEPWEVGLIGGALAAAVDRAGEVKFAALGDTDAALVRRVAACVNLCAGAPTEALEFAFTEIASTSPRWALLALNISNLTRAHVAMVRDYIDDVVKAAGRKDPARGFGRPQ
jgi:hypothetical protein